MTPAEVNAEIAVEYRDIPGFPGYRVGDDGSVWGRRKYHRNQRDAPWRRLHMQPHQGYLLVRLQSNGGERVTRSVHGLVLAAFVGPRRGDQQACHWNGVRTDNRASNLRWGSREDNAADRERHGMHRRGSAASWAKLDEAIVREMRLRYAAGGVTQQQLAEEHGVTNQVVSRIIRREKWAHV